MFARVTSLQAAPDKMDAGTRYIQDTVIPLVQKQEGFKGYLGFVDRKIGKAMAITFWETEAQLRASENMAAQVRSQGGQILGAAQQPTVEIYEVGAHRMVGGKVGAARLTPDQVAPDKIEDGLRYFRETIIPAAEKMPGWQGIFLLVNRQAGKALGIGLWETEEALRASQPAVGQLLAQEDQILGRTQASAQEIYEVVINV